MWIVALQRQFKDENKDSEKGEVHAVSMRNSVSSAFWRVEKMPLAIERTTQAHKRTATPTRRDKDVISKMLSSFTVKHIPQRFDLFESIKSPPFKRINLSFAFYVYQKFEIYPI